MGTLNCFDKLQDYVTSARYFQNSPEFPPENGENFLLVCYNNFGVLCIDA